MSPEQYQKAMAELGVSRGGFETDAEIEGTPSGSQMGHNKQPTLLNAGSSTKPPRLPMEPVPERLKGNEAISNKAKKWWAGLSPEERKKHGLQRAENARGQGKKAARVVSPAVFESAMKKVFEENAGLMRRLGKK